MKNQMRFSEVYTVVRQCNISQLLLMIFMVHIRPTTRSIRVAYLSVPGNDHSG